MRERGSVRGGNAGQRPRVGLGAHHHNAVFDLALALVDHGKALDLALAAGFGDEVRHGALMPVGLGLHAGLLRERRFPGASRDSTRP